MVDSGLLEHSVWFEPLPEQCPPADAQEMDGSVKLYRVVINNPVNSEDFTSQRFCKPNKVFQPPVSECIARAVSLYDNLEGARKVKKLPIYKEVGRIIEVVLGKTDGVAKCTNHTTGHYSWWRSKSFNPDNVIEL